MAFSKWNHAEQIGPCKYTCAYCGQLQSTNEGFVHSAIGKICICSNCEKPTYLEGDIQSPGAPYGAHVEELPNSVHDLYAEARSCISAQALTASALVCRKVLMHVAHERGMKNVSSFIACVEYLAHEGYIPPNGQGWVDHIRKKGNEANHEIVLVNDGEAKLLITLTEMLLRFIYELPGKVPAPSEAS